MDSIDKGGRSNLQWLVLSKMEGQIHSGWHSQRRKVKFSVVSTDKGGMSNLQWLVLTKVEGQIHCGRH